MQITIFSDTGTDILVHGPLRAASNYAVGPIGEIEFQDENQIEIARGLRWLRGQVYDRGNVICACTFSAERAFPSLLAGKAWLAQHLLNVRRGPTLKFQDQGGVVTLTGGVLGPIRSRPLGVSVSLTYRFTYSGVTTA